MGTKHLVKPSRYWQSKSSDKGFILKLGCVSYVLYSYNTVIELVFWKSNILG